MPHDTDETTKEALFLGKHVEGWTRTASESSGHLLATPHALDMLRARIIDAMVSVAFEEGFAGASVTSVCARARISRRTFYEAFDSRETCFLAVLDQGHRRASILISQAFACEERWLDGIRAALARLLSFFDAEPCLARVWLLESLAAGSWALEYREHQLAALTQSIVEHWRPPPDAGSHPLSAVSVMASVLGIIQTHLVTRREEPLITLLGPLMGLVAVPYHNAQAVLAEVEHGKALAQKMLAGHDPHQPPCAADAVQIPAALRHLSARRPRQCLLFLGKHPGASNREVASAIGVTSHTQISALLARLARTGLLFKHAGRPGHPNAWNLTPYGWQVLNVHASHTSETPRDIPVTS